MISWTYMIFGNITIEEKLVRAAVLSVYVPSFCYIAIVVISGTSFMILAIAYSISDY